MEISGFSNAALSSKYPSSVETSQSTVTARPAQGSDGTSVAAQNQATKSVTAASAQANAENNTSELNSAVEKVKEFVSSATNGIEFSVDKDLGITVVKIVDRETSETIRQIPSEEMVDLAKALDKLQGLLLKQKA